MPMAYQEILRICNTNYTKSCAYVFALFAAAPGVKSQSHQCIKQAVTRQSCPVTANPGEAIAWVSNASGLTCVAKCWIWCPAIVVWFADIRIVGWRSRKIVFVSGSCEGAAILYRVCDSH